MDNITVSFDMDNCHMELNYPYALLHITTGKLKKLFKLMCCQHWRNMEAIRLTEESIKLCIEDVETEAKIAVKSFADGYRDTKCNYSLTTDEKRKIERENKRLYNNAVRKKKGY